MSTEAKVLNISDPEICSSDQVIALVREIMCLAFESMMDLPSYQTFDDNLWANILSSCQLTEDSIEQDTKRFANVVRSASGVTKKTDDLREHLFELFRRSYLMCRYATMKAISLAHEHFKNQDNLKTFEIFTNDSLKYFAGNHHLAVFQVGDRFFAFSTANVFNPDGTLPRLQNQAYDRARTLFVADSLEEIIKEVQRFEGGKNWQSKKISKNEANDYLKTFMDGDGLL